MKKNTGIIATTLLAITPVILWSPSLTSGFSLRSLSQVLALSGSVLFSINFILSTRHKALEPLFGGLNRIYIIHHLTGQYALIMLIFHPILLGFFYIKISLQAAFTILFPPIGEFATWLGLTALLIMIFLLILTLYVKLPYNIWKSTHKFLGVSFLFATLHIFFIQSTVATNIPLRIYMLGICSLGLFAYTYKVLLGKLFVKKYKYQVERVEIEENVTQITLSPVGKSIKNYLPGQFVFVSFTSLGITNEQHPFSLTSFPGEESLSIAAKSSGDYTETLKLLKVGAEAKIEGPFGRFSYKESPRQKQIWIAGGIGVTPFVSMAKNLKKENGYDICLYYVVRTPKEAIFVDTINSISHHVKKLSVVLFPTKNQGHLTAEIVKNNFEDFKERDIFICGPPPMMKSLRLQFNKLGIRNNHIFSEEFSLD